MNSFHYVHGILSQYNKLHWMCVSCIGPSLCVITIYVHAGMRAQVRTRHRRRAGSPILVYLCPPVFPNTDQHHYNTEVLKLITLTAVICWFYTIYNLKMHLTRLKFLRHSNSSPGSKFRTRLSPYNVKCCLKCISNGNNPLMNDMRPPLSSTIS